MSGVYTTKRITAHPYRVNDNNGILGKSTVNGLTTDVVVSSPRLDQITTSFRTDGEGGQPDVSPGSIIRSNLDKNLRPWDSGHEFSTIKGELLLSHPNWGAVGTHGTRYLGPLMGNFPSGWNAAQPVLSVSLPDINLQYGTKAISQTIPTKPATKLLQAIAELVIDLPRLPSTEIPRPTKSDKLAVQSLARYAAGNYLSTSFAWVPLVSDVLKTCQAVLNVNKLLSQYVRDSGMDHSVRRRFEFDPIRSTTTTRQTNQLLKPFTSTIESKWSDLFSSSSAMRGGQSTTITSTEEYWFRGAYSYALDPGSTLMEKMHFYAQLADKTLGVAFDLELLWELAPWTWLVDWFADIGSIMTNISKFQANGLVLRYGYLMHKTVSQCTVTHDGLVMLSGPTGSVTSTLRITKKERVRANPYGFGLNPASLNEGQWAILVSLGLSSGNHKLL